MVRFLLLILAPFAISPLLGQINCDTIAPGWYDPPMFTSSGWGKLNDFFVTNLIYPETAKADKIEGQVFVAFWIDTIGFTSEHKVIQSVRQDLDEEALRVAKLIKFEIPAKNVFGDPIGVCIQLPIRFRLDDTEFLYYKQSEKVKPKSKNKTTPSGYRM